MQKFFSLLTFFKIIYQVFRQKLHRSFKNVKVVSNRMVFDDKGCLVAFKGKFCAFLFDLILNSLQVCIPYVIWFCFSEHKRHSLKLCLCMFTSLYHMVLLSLT